MRMIEVSMQLLRDAAYVLRYVTDLKNNPDTAAQACAAEILRELWTTSSSYRITVRSTLVEDILRHMDKLDHPELWSWLYNALAQEMKQ